MHWCPLHGWENDFSSTTNPHVGAAEPMLTFWRSTSPSGPSRSTHAPSGYSSSTPTPSGRFLLTTAPSGYARSTPPQMRASPSAGPPAWYLDAIASLRTTMTTAFEATGVRRPMVSDPYYLGEIADALRLWNQTLLTHIELVRYALTASKKPLADKPLT